MFRHAFVVSTALPPSEISHRLAALVGEPVPLLRVLRGPETSDPFRITESRQFTGSVTPASFSAYPTRVVRGLVPPRVSGTITGGPDRSVVAVTVAPPPSDLLLLAVASALLAGLGIYVLSLAGVLRAFWLIGAGLLAIAALPWLLTSAASRSTALKFRVHATRLLTEQRPEA
jgi:hypothetical protein